MVKYYCDKCGIEMRGSSDIASRVAFDGVQITPGHIGTKAICKRCFEDWGKFIRKFFERND